MENQIQTKPCSKCGVSKHLSEFSNQSSMKDGKKHQCKACDALYKQQYYSQKRDHILEYQAEYDKEHPEVGRRANQKYYEVHGDDIRRKARERDAAAPPEVKTKARRKLKESNPLHSLFVQTRNRAKQSGIPFTIEETDLYVPEICPVLGIPLRWEVGRRSPNTPSIDRRVPELGYIPSNIAIISWQANRLKNDGTAEEFHKIADWMDTSVEKSEAA